MRTRTKLALATIGLSATVAGIAGPAFAAGAGQPTATAASSTNAGAGSAGHERLGPHTGGEFAHDLAAKLGLPQQTVTTAVQQARSEVRAAQADGSATRGQFVTKLAAKLGLDPTNVRNAVQAVRAQERAEG